MEWLYEGKVFEPDENLLNEYVGFVYIITEIESDIKYIGKKLFWRSKTLPVTKTRKRRKKTLVESDWRTYYGSSTNVQEALQTLGAAAYRREILHLCRSKGDASYLEAYEQFVRGAIIKPDYYNGIINCRINRKHLKLTENPS